MIKKEDSYNWKIGYQGDCITIKENKDNREELRSYMLAINNNIALFFQLIISSFFLIIVIVLSFFFIEKKKVIKRWCHCSGTSHINCYLFNC